MSWRLQDAERELRSLELFGMRFGLERMRRLMTVLDSPQRDFQAIHVVGTNGKSSTTRMIASILEHHGIRTGAYLSPHLISYTERIQVAERDVREDEFAAAIERAAWAAERVNHTLAADDHVTQFELVTAAAFWELARQQVEVAVIEAGLGGRYDATNVLDASVCVLTSVGLEHTRWLGPTVRDIATEKLAVVPPGATLVLGERLQGEVVALAQGLAERDGVRLVHAHASDIPEPLAARGAFQRENFALARAAAESHLAGRGLPVSEDAIRAAAAEVRVPGRFEVLAEDPLTIFDGAHNTDAAIALRDALAPRRARASRGARVRRARGQGRGGHAAHAPAALPARLVHRAAEPARAAAGDARVARRAARFRRDLLRAGPRERPRRGVSMGRRGARHCPRDRFGLPYRRAHARDPLRARSGDIAPSERLRGPVRSRVARPHRARRARRAASGARARARSLPVLDGEDRRDRRRAHHPRVVRCRLWLRPPVPLSSLHCR